MRAVSVPVGHNNFRLDSNTLNDLPYKDKIITKVIRKIKKIPTNNIRDETLGILFERLLREQERKDLGQFYTPQEVVDYILSYLDLKKDSKILDPTCGCGVFLVSAYRHLSRVNKNALENLYGVDLNKSATKITRINLWLRNNQEPESLKILERNIKVGNSIVKSKKIDRKGFDWETKFSNITEEGGFDFIIGNPPYVTLRKGHDYGINESLYSKIVNGNTNSASLVIIKSYELLKQGGIMAFVLPKTMGRVHSYSKLREFLVNNTKIIHILDLGICFKDVRGEQMILFVQKTNNLKEIKKNKVKIGFFNRKKEFKIPQRILMEHNSFLVFDKKLYYNVINKIKGTELKKLAEIFRGVSISPKSKSVKKSKGRKRVPIVKGNDISKFNYDHRHFIDTSVLGESMKIKLMKEKKIILQNIFSAEAGIISCIDDKGNISFDTVTNIVPKKDNVNVEYIYGLLNSKLLNFYLMYAIYNQSVLTMHTDKAYIGRIPIKIARGKTKNKIVRLVKKLNRDNKDKLLPLLDAYVFKLYKINDKEKEIIDKGLAQIMSEKSFW